MNSATQASLRSSPSWGIAWSKAVSASSRIAWRTCSVSSKSVEKLMSAARQLAGHLMRRLGAVGPRLVCAESTTSRGDCSSVSSTPGTSWAAVFAPALKDHNWAASASPGLVEVGGQRWNA